MTADARVDTRVRLAALVGPPTPAGPGAREPAGGRWVPSPPEDAERAAVAEPARADAVATRTPPAAIRDRALAAATAAYTAAHGHPLDAEALTDGPERGRWATPVRMALVACGVLVLIGGVVVAGTLGRVPTTVVEAEPVFAVDEPPTGQDVVVHVVGQVAGPGVFELAAGSRVADAVDAAGGVGPDADLTGLNLARVLVDGEQVVVPRPGEVAAGPADGRIDVNAADAVTLQELPGIGEVLAHRIVTWREQNGRFSTVDELTQVSGIGPAVLESVRELVIAG